MSVAVGDPTPLRGDLDEKQCMETLQEAYLHAVAAAARCSLAKPNRDRGIDWIVGHQSDEHVDDFEAQLRVQLKATYQVEPSPDLESVGISIANSQLTRLARSPVINSSILVVMLVSRDIDEWIEVQSNHMLLRHCCYWRNLEGHPITGKDETVVRVPTAQVFDEFALCDIMRRVGSGGRA
ncbi:DUF4365 domain-containing protein [Micromonospora sp. WP24]|nr:DUF4365 domain-containing protein [Micromonospora sp. WP24]